MPFIKKIIIFLLILGGILIAFYLILPVFINPLHAAFYSFTYLGFIMVLLSGIFFLLYFLKIKIYTVYVGAIWLSSGIIIFVLNQFIYAQFFSDLLLKYFHPLYPVLFCAIGAVIIMIEIVRYLYLKTPKKP